MKNSNTITLGAVLIVICLLVMGNAAYFIVYGTSHIDSHVSYLIFYNLAVLSLFLPALSKGVYRAGFLSGGLKVLCAMYYVVETVLAFLLLSADASAKSAAVWQLVPFMLFLVAFIAIESSNRRTDQSARRDILSRSAPLREARTIVAERLAVSQTAAERAILRDVMDELVTTPLTLSDDTIDIEYQILSEVRNLVNNPTIENSKKISQLIMRRNAVLRALG